ncbi:MAG: DUF1573 domain-containing protein [Planctomycetes bacterium]|nr:DUF1573 domain-containing protein [Planctomycetota bacterium]
MRARTIGLWCLYAAVAVLFVLPPLALGAASDDEVYGPPPPPRDRKYPVAVCPEPTFNFGTVFEGDSVRHAFVVENRGEAPLLIERVTAGCRCTVPEFDKEIPAGGSGHVALVLNTKGLYGPLHKSATVFTTDPRKRQFEIRLDGEIKQLLRFEPRTPAIQAVQGPGKATTDVKALAGSDLPVEILEVKAQSADVECVVETVEPGKSFVLHISVDTNSARTYRYETLSIKAKAGDRDASAALSLTIRLTKEIQFERGRPYLNFFKKEVTEWQAGKTPTLKKCAVLENVRGKPFEVTSIDVKDPWIKVAFEKIADGSKWQICVEVLSKPETLASTVGRTLATVHTDSETVPTVDLHVMATF